MNKVKITTKNYGFSFYVPDNFNQVKKDAFNKLQLSNNTIFAFSLTKLISLYVNFNGFIESENLDSLINYNLDDSKIIDKDINEKYKDIYIKNNDKKIIISYKIINGMIISFALNLDPYKKEFDNKKLKHLKEVKIIHDIIDSVHIFKAKKLPVINKKETKKVIFKDPSIKSVAEQIINKECFYLGKIVPDFYFKVENEDGNFIRVLNDEIYISMNNERPKFIKDNNIKNAIVNLIKKSTFLNIIKLDDFPKNNNIIIYKLDKEFYLGENNQENPNVKSFIKELNQILNINILENIQNNKEVLNLPEDIIFEEVKEKDSIKIDLKNYDIEIEEMNIDEDVQPIIIKKEDEPVIEIMEKTLNKIVVDNLEDIQFDEYKHYLEEGKEIKFTMPKAFDNKVLYDDNVFDVMDKDENYYRIFLFPCDTLKSYKDKLDDWMDKNKETSGINIKIEEEFLLDDINVNKYIFEDNRFYLTRYINNYLFAISSLDTANNIYIALNILKEVNINDIDKEDVEKLIRRNRSIDLIKEFNLAYVYDKIIDISAKKVKIRDLDEVVKRVLVLKSVCNFASDAARTRNKRELKASKKVFLKEIDQLNLRSSMTKNEEKLFNSFDEDLAIDISWHFEAMHVLMWSLGLTNEYPYFDEHSNTKMLTELVSKYKSYIHMVSMIKPRTKKEIMDAYDYIYRINEYVNEMINLDTEISSLVDPEVVFEHLRALTYLITSEKWDDIKLQ